MTSVDSLQRFGPYEVLERLGTGGMGEVYKAHDTRLGRIVALKVLAPRFEGDDVRRKRFLREARAISLLSHPRICSLYDIGTEGDRQYLVMEYIEGETLAQRLQRGPLPLDAALRYAVDIATALTAAHKRGIVHRDLKPGNVMLTGEHAKLLDFGLASLSEGTLEGSVAEPLTSDLSVIGTMEYMAPEQLNGEASDARTDIFAFGVMLYEMVTGERPFTGTTRANLISSILVREPRSILEIDPTLPAGLDRVIRAALAKQRDERIQTAHDVALQLEWLLDGGGLELPIRRRRRARAVVAAIGVALLVAGAALLGVWFARPPALERGAEVRFEVTSPTASGDIRWAALSPDGKSLAFVTESSDEHRTLWVRDLASTTARELVGAVDVLEPFWSPDSDAIAFFDLHSLRVLPLNSTRSEAVAEADAPRGGAWSTSGMILYAPHVASGLFAVASTGGTPVQVTKPDLQKGDSTHRWPEFLPDGERFVFVVGSKDPARAGLYIGSIRRGVLRRLSANTNRAVVASDGSILFVQSGRLYRQELDLDALQLRGQPQLVAEDVYVSPQLTGGSGISVARDGTLLHLTVPPTLSELLWFDRAGNRVAAAPIPRADYVNPALSPDGRSLAVARIEPESGRNTLWIFDLVTGNARRVAVDERNADGPRWSLDGRTLYYSSDRNGKYDVFAFDLERAAEPRVVFQSEGYAQVVSVRKAGLLIHNRSDKVAQALLLRPDGSALPLPLQAADAFAADLSPNGRWIAYKSMRQGVGSNDIFVRTLTGPGSTIQISTGGGSQPRWGEDGRLYYVDANRVLNVVEFDEGRVSAPRPLFRLNVGHIDYASADYQVSKDGERFLVISPVDSGKRSTLTVILNFQARH